jgi:hypothetical protein
LFRGRGIRLRLEQWGPNAGPVARGADLFFRIEDNQIMVTTYAVKGDAFAADEPRIWSQQRIAGFGLNNRNYDVARDGKHIVALVPGQAPGEQTAPNQVILLLNC